MLTSISIADVGIRGISIICGSVIFLVLLVFVIVVPLLNRLSQGVDMTTVNVADEIEAFLTGTGGDWDWGDFLDLRIKDDQLEAIPKP